jgi:hypothetical protein
MGAEEWMSATSRVFSRLFMLELMAQDSGMTTEARAEHAELTREGIALFQDPDAGRRALTTREPGWQSRPT